MPSYRRGRLSAKVDRRSGMKQAAKGCLDSIAYLPHAAMSAQPGRDLSQIFSREFVTPVQLS
jgi:hypothetical protein